MPVDPALKAREERLDALKLLTGQLAHDFNNLIAPLLGYASLIKEEVPANSQAMQYATAMDSSARKSERILDKVLLTARPQRRFRAQKTDFRALVEREIKAWSDLVRPLTALEVKTDLAACELWIDPAQWQSACQQLLDNARFALAKGGLLEVSLRAVELTREKADALGLYTTRVYELRFCDNGIGMPAQVCERAFDPFYTTRSKSKCQGLGLTLVHSITRHHTGQVLMESAENHGTAVTIYLPADLNWAGTAEDSQAASAKITEFAPVPTGKTILLVDDDSLVLEVVRACLMRAGYKVLIARDGQEALALFRNHTDELGLMLTDVTMPNMGGIELVLETRKLNPRLPVVLMSGDAEATREEKLAKLGPQRPRILKKPFSVKELMAFIRP